METPWSTTAKYISSTAVSVDFGEGNEAADTAANEAVHKKPTDDLMPFSDLKSLTAKYIHQVWQKEWDEAVILSNKLHEMLPKLSGKKTVISL